MSWLVLVFFFLIFCFGGVKVGKAFAVAYGLVGILLVMRLLSGANIAGRNAIIFMEASLYLCIGSKAMREPPGGGKVKVTELKALPGLTVSGCGIIRIDKWMGSTCFGEEGSEDCFRIQISFT